MLLLRIYRERLNSTAIIVHTIDACCQRVRDDDFSDNTSALGHSPPIQIMLIHTHSFKEAVSQVSTRTTCIAVNDNAHNSGAHYDQLQTHASKKRSNRDALGRTTWANATTAVRR